MSTIQRPLVLTHGSIEHTFLVPTNLFFALSQIKDQFIKELPDPTEGFGGDGEPASPAELFALFLGYTASHVDREHPSQFDEVLKFLLEEFDSRYISGSDVHSFAVSLLSDESHPTTLEKVKGVIRNYFDALVSSKKPTPRRESELLHNAARTASDDSSSKQKAKIVAVFGGQGNTEDYFEELRELYSTYKGLIGDDLIRPIADKLTTLVRTTENVERIYTQGLDVLSWLTLPDKTPDQEYLLSVPVSCPLICVLQLAHYAVTARSMGLTPGDLRNSLSGTTGHSQGLVTAIAIAASGDWKSFIENSLKAVTLLFFIGTRCLEVYPRTSLPPHMMQDSLANGEGRPSPMLSIRDLSQEQVESYINQTNKHLPNSKHVSVSLVNGARNLVVSGPPESLYGLNLSLRNKKSPSGLDQSRVPHNSRKLRFSNRFLTIYAPFHSHLLEPATEIILQDIINEHIDFNVEDLKIPVYDTYTGENFQFSSFGSSSSSDSSLNSVAHGDISLAGRIAKCITQLPVYWEKATQFESTHILDFGPGGVTGLGVLTHRNKEGTGARVIIAGSLDVPPPEDEYGFKQEIFNRVPGSIKWASNWLEEFKPKLVKVSGGKTYVDTKFSRLIGRAPLMVPGMTPTTVNPEIVAATINAGYHIELAGGGYFSAEGMQAALEEVKKNIVPGSGIAINLIYVNPRMLQWGIPLIKDLREKGFPIQSLTIGAGVPSLEVATEYIETLGITHLGLKPGSVESISQAIAIAKAHPNFPVVVQWTGGRGGGHHSFEDFHQPILQMYAKIRRCKNIVLIAGSGFGSDEDTYPYLTGSWSKKYDFPPMPFDGVLFGSRVMTAKEAHTSLEAKKVIAACSGVPDSEWENTYKKPTGGIITVRSEMGEPIHKLATRGVMLWKELDDTIFTLPKNKKAEALAQKKDYIIERLNKDFQKPWFGKNSNGVCDIEDMTYEEVAYRLLELLYVKKSKRWVDISLRNFFGDFLRRVEERFVLELNATSLIQHYHHLQDDPYAFTDKFFDNFPLAKVQLVNQEDCDFFLLCCARPWQKPVPFVPVIDDRFEFFFKKDSLWQSEDLETVVDEDVQRTCILHGPVAAQFTNKVNEPIKEILDSIHEGHISRLLKDVYDNNESKIPVIEYLSKYEQTDSSIPKGVSVTKGDAGSVRYSLDDPRVVPSNDEWLSFLAGTEQNWLHALITADRIVQDLNHVTNSIRDVLAAAPGIAVELEHKDVPSKTKLTLYDNVNGSLKPAVELFLIDKSTIGFNIIESRTADGNPAVCKFFYKYHPQDGFAPILEVMEGRNDRIKEFYWKLWFGSKVPVELDIDVDKEILGDTVTVNGKDIGEFTHAIGNKCEAFVSRPGKETYAPMDFAIVVGWKSIMKAIFPRKIDGDLLKLVHLSNGYRMMPGAEPMKKGDVISSRAEIRAVLNQPTGKLVEVVGTLYREGKPVMEIISEFFYRGEYSDFDNAFQKVTETPVLMTIKTPKDEAVLKSKEWFILEKDVSLVNQVLTFRCSSVYRFKNADVYSSIVTKGEITIELPTKEVIQIASIDYECDQSYGNPVIDYLNRNGHKLEQAVKFENAIPISNGEELKSKAPNTNAPYAIVSGDYNPIHVSRVFASLAKLPGTITHGMYSSGSVRALVEEWAAQNVASRVRAFSCTFTGMVLPNDTLQTSLQHIGMINGRKIIKVETRNSETEELVLSGEAEIDQPATAYLFTGQGSQEEGMGMDLYKTSSVAKEVWDKADRHFIDNYGFSILHIVNNNPKELTVHFGGLKGKKIRENYISMNFETISEDGKLQSEKIFKEVDHNSTSYTFVSDSGLLSATQFTQPALTLMEKAAYEDIKSKGLIPENIMFAGHSLGEYSALSALANVMPIESLVDVVFYRGMTMQVMVPRDELGRSNYSMVAVNPQRVNDTFNDAALRFVVDEVGKKTGWLLEIVNFNVENNQYVAAGDLRALDTLTNVLNFIKLNKIDIVKLQAKLSLEEVAEHLAEIIKEVAAQAEAKPQPIDLQRGFAVIPLKGISVPFHSSYLRCGVTPFQTFLNKKIPKSSVKPKDLINKYIPNLTARPFEITKEYFQDVYNLTKSEKIKHIIDNWESYENA